MRFSNTKNPEIHFLILIADVEELSPRLSEIEKQVLVKDSVKFIRQGNTWLVKTPDKNLSEHEALEYLRVAGSDLVSELVNWTTGEAMISGKPTYVVALSEGLALGSYRFSKYVSKKPENELKQLFIPDVSEEELVRLQSVVQGVFTARDLVNEPVVSLNASDLAQFATHLGERLGFRVEVLEKKKIEALKMGGLLGVNKGSIDPPTFTIMEYKPSEAVNEKPIVLVGKGVMFDTGGLSLKPTPGSMDSMKSDMSGAAAVLGTFEAVASLEMPVYLVGLIPATDNRPGENAITPGDIITMYDGTTVEVLNTDAEGRLILADALAYAKKYEPALAIDLATLTGAAVMAVSKHANVVMGTADEHTFSMLEKAGYTTYERCVRLPLWKEYRDMLKSQIADLKNIGGREAGAITAGKFLEHFTAYPWIHIDIAPTAFLEDSGNAYRGKGATGTGVRLLVEFFNLWVNEHNR
ncbi:MAG: leucyl aminopeptidase family protein [Thermaurantimonas sp.]